MNKFVTFTRHDFMRGLPLAAAVGPLVFTAAWFVLGFMSRGYRLWDLEVTSYSAISQPISGLGLGETALFMNSAFVLFGVLLMAGVFGIVARIPGMTPRARTTTRVLLMLPGVGAIIDGFYSLEAFLMHFVGFALVLSSIGGFLVVGVWLRRIDAWRRVGGWLIVASPVTLALAVLYFGTFDPANAGANVGVAGLTQRILVTEILFWYVVLAVHAYRQPDWRDRRTCDVL